MKRQESRKDPAMQKVKGHQRHSVYCISAIYSPNIGLPPTSVPDTPRHSLSAQTRKLFGTLGEAHLNLIIFTTRWNLQLQLLRRSMRANNSCRSQQKRVLAEEYTPKGRDLHVRAICLSDRLKGRQTEELKFIINYRTTT